MGVDQNHSDDELDSLLCCQLTWNPALREGGRVDMILQHMKGETGPCDDMLCASNAINDGALCNSLVNLTFLTFLEEASKSKPPSSCLYITVSLN